MADTHAGRRWLVAIPALTGCDRGADEKVAPAVIWAQSSERATRIKEATR